MKTLIIVKYYCATTWTSLEVVNKSLRNNPFPCIQTHAGTDPLEKQRLARKSSKTQRMHPVLLAESWTTSHSPTFNTLNVFRALRQQGPPSPELGGERESCPIIALLLYISARWQCRGSCPRVGGPGGWAVGGWGWLRRSTKQKTLTCWKTRTWRCLHYNSSQMHSVIFYQYYLKFRSIPVFKLINCGGKVAFSIKDKAIKPNLWPLSWLIMVSGLCSCSSCPEHVWFSAAVWIYMTYGDVAVIFKLSWVLWILVSWSRLHSVPITS